MNESRVQWPFNGFLRTVDRDEKCVCLFESQRALSYFLDRNSDIVGARGAEPEPARS